MTGAMKLTGVGLWSSQLRYGNAGEAADAAAELDELGFPALWIPDVGGPVLDAVDNLLGATSKTVIATGILNLWMHEPAEVASRYATLTETHGERFLLGIGCSHAPLIDSWSRGATANRSPRPRRSSTVSTHRPPRCRPVTACSRHWARRCWSCRRLGPPARIRT